MSPRKISLQSRSMYEERICMKRKIIDTLINSMVKKIPELREALEKRTVMFFAVPMVAAIMIVIYYAPIFGMPGVSEDVLMKAGDIFYDAVDLFRAAPVIAGVMMLLIMVLYKEPFWKVFFGAAYAAGLLLGLVPVLMAMDFSNVGELATYPVHIVIIGLAVFLMLQEKRMKE